MALVIGLTGGLGSGKSTVRQILGEAFREECVVFDADAFGHLSYAPGTTTNAKLVEHFGSGILDARGGVTIDRAKLGALVFGDSQKLRTLNALVWPAIRDLLHERVLVTKRENPRCRAIFIEAAIMLEAGWTDLVDEVWCVLVDRPVAIERVRRRNPNLAVEAIAARLNSQMSNAARMKRCHVLFWNNESGLERLTRLVSEEYRVALARHEGVGASGRTLVQIVDENNREVDVRKRCVMRHFNLRHRATYVVLVLPDGSLLVEVRSRKKDYHPLKIDATPGGVVDFGETYESNAIKEMEEELGLRSTMGEARGRLNPGQMRALGDFYFEDDRTRVWGRLFVRRVTALERQSLVLQEEEVEAVRSMTAREVLEAGPRAVTPDSLAALSLFVERWGKEYLVPEKEMTMMSDAKM